MKSTPLIVNWHNDNAPIYSAHFEPGGKGRLATAGGDNNVRLWRIEADGEDRKVEYLSTLSKHTQAVNVVRFAPKGEMLASAGDDGNVLIWVPAETHSNTPGFGNDGLEDKETWRVKHMCRSSGAEIYDLAWSPDAQYFIIGSMDNVARIYNRETSTPVRQIADHGHYVQGVAWDPLNEYVATQSSDRSVHIYTLRNKEGEFTLEHDKVAFHARTDLPSRRTGHANSPAPPDHSHRASLSTSDSNSFAVGSPIPSMPGTPTSVALPMNPPSVISHSRRSSFGSSPSMRRSASPAPSMPLPAVMPMEASPKPHPYSGIGVRNANLYANETLTSFFRRLTFTPDGSLLFTPAGQYQTQHPPAGPGQEGPNKTTYDVVNTVYIYTRGGINKPPIAHLPGHKKPSVVVKCSPIYYTIRKGAAPPTKHITIDTTSSEDAIADLPEPAVRRSSEKMDPPPTSSLKPSIEVGEKSVDGGEKETSAATEGPKMAFALPYRMVYAVATQESVLLYDTQQQTPLCVVSNLHCATFTDLTWSNDGLTLLMTSSDGFCSTLTFSPNELGTIYTGDLPQPSSASIGGTPKHLSIPSGLSANSASNTPIPTPTSSIAPPSPFPGLHSRTLSSGLTAAPSPPATLTSLRSDSGTPVTLGGMERSGSASGSGGGLGFVGTPSVNTMPGAMRPSSPTRSNSTSSIATTASFVGAGGYGTTGVAGQVISNPTLVGGSMPSITAGSSVGAQGIAGIGGVGSGMGGITGPTPPQTPRSAASSVSGVAGAGSALKRDMSESEAEKGAQGGPLKKRRVAPTLVPQRGEASASGAKES